MELTAYVLKEQLGLLDLVRRFVDIVPVVLDEPLSTKRLKQIIQPALLIDDRGVSFVEQGQVLHPQWLKQARRVVKAGRKNEGLLRALKLSPGMRVIDATAGLGVDSLLMASTGAQVLMLEKHPVLALLLSDQMRQIADHPHWRSIYSQLEVRHTDAQQHLLELTKSRPDSIDLVYLDPMFDAGAYKSKVSGSMQVLHRLAAPPEPAEQDELLNLALGCAHKVVVKRPLSAAPLAKRNPQSVSSNLSVRYDIYTGRGAAI